MVDIDAYRRGYERGKAELEKIQNEGLEDIPERAVKGLFSIPRHLIDEFFGDEDEKRGFKDAIEGNDFDP